MTTFVSNRDGGKTNEEGHYRFQVKTWAGNILTGFAPTQNSPTGMSILISAGDARVDYGEYGFTCWSDSTLTATFATANPTNPRIDRVVAYIDLNQTPQDEIPNNPGLLKIAVIAGTPDPSPTRPNDAAVDSGVVDNPWFDIADVIVIANETTISTSDITDTREFIQLLYDPLSMSGDGWIQSQDLDPPSSIVYNGQNSYLATWSGVDLTGLLSPGIRLKATRTVAAQTQCTSLNGTTQYYSKSSPSGITFTDDFVVSVWVKLSSYPAAGTDRAIVSRYNGTSGWILQIQDSGQLLMVGRNGGASNQSYVLSYQSLPLNKWVHVTAQLDMSAFTATTTTSYIMVNGVDVPASVARNGTNPTALIQAGDLQVGASNSLVPFPGKIAQVAIFNAKVTQATIRSYISQGLVGTETSLASAYSFNNSINDLTANANNLTASGSAVATNADSPFGNSGASTTNEFGIVSSAAFSTDTTANIQVPEGCALPTSGGVSSVVYSHSRSPHKFPTAKEKWTIKTIYIAYETVAFGGVNVWTASNFRLTVPIGAWNIGFKTNLQLHSTVTGGRNGVGGLYAATSNPLVNNVYNTKLIAQVPYVSLSDSIGTIQDSDDFTLSAAENFIFYAAIFGSSGGETYIVNYNSIRAYIKAENGYL